jgi:hypothetical protein
MRIQRPLTHGRHHCSKDVTLRLAYVKATRDLNLHTRRDLRHAVRESRKNTTDCTVS